MSQMNRPNSSLSPSEKALADAMLWASVYYEGNNPTAIIGRILAKLKEDGWMLVPMNRFVEYGVVDTGEVEVRSVNGEPLFRVSL